MKKLSKIKLNDLTVLSDNELKMVLGGSSSGCGTAREACKGKGAGDSCESGDPCSSGICKPAPFAGIICWR